MQLKILVIGDLILDRWITGCFYKMTNEWATPKKVIAAQSTRVTLGGAGNAAAKLVSLNGCEVTFLVIGDGGICAAAEDVEHPPGLKFKHLPHTGYRTPEKVRIIATDCDERFRYDWDGGWQDIHDGAVVDYLRSTRPDAVLISDYGKGTCTPDVCQAAIRSCGVSVVDPKGPSWEKYRGATIIKCNADELAETGKSASDLAMALGSDVVVTHGHAAVELYGKGSGSVKRFPVPEVEFVDATGAGDMFAAGLTLDFVKHRDVESAISYAIQCASASVSQLGTGL